MVLTQETWWMWQWQSKFASSCTVMLMLLLSPSVDTVLSFTTPPSIGEGEGRDPAEGECMTTNVLEGAGEDSSLSVPCKYTACLRSMSCLCMMCLLFPSRTSSRVIEVRYQLLFVCIFPNQLHIVLEIYWIIIMGICTRNYLKADFIKLSSSYAWSYIVVVK